MSHNSRLTTLCLLALFSSYVFTTNADDRQASAELILPVSLNDVMVSLVNHSADPIWVAAWNPPESEKEWRELERRAYQIEIAGKLLSIPGTGPHDKDWAADPAWQVFSKRLSEVGKEAVTAISAKDMKGISSAGDDLVEVCEGCHIAFKPDEPTGGKYGELSPTEKDLENK